MIMSFNENRRSESHTSREVVNEFLPALSTFIYRLVEIRCKKCAYHFFNFVMIDGGKSVIFLWE
jgi:hypothetical protein